MSTLSRKSKVNSGTTIKLTKSQKQLDHHTGIFIAGVAASSLMLLLACSLTVMAQRTPCDPRYPITHPCTSMAERAVDVVNALGQTAAAKGDVTLQIQQARRRFFDAYPQGPGRAQAEAEFANLLDQKDFYYFYITLYPAPRGMSSAESSHYMDLFLGLGGKLDDGIRPFASRLFNNWTDLIRERMGRGRPNSLSELSSRFRTAFAESQPQYEQYRLARNWAEFAAAGRSITDDPKTYATLLLAIRRPWGISGTFAEPDLMEKAAEHYRAMTEVFGEDSVLQAAKRLMAAPKNKDGNLTPVLQANGLRFETPYTAFKAMLGDGNPRNYILTAILDEAWNEQQTGHMREADKMYKYLVAAYGTKAVIDAAEQVRRAEKNEYDFIKDTKALGVQRNRRHHALQDLLSNKDPKGYVRAILAFHDNHTSAPEVDAAYARLVSAHGEKAVVSAGEQLTAFWRAEQFPDLPQEYAPLMRDYAWGNEMHRRDAEGGAQRAPSTAASGKKSMASRSGSASGSAMGIYELLLGLLDGSRSLPRAATNADMMENPEYVTWAKFPLGTNVTYAFRSWSERGKQIVPGSSTNPNLYKGLIQVYKLKELNAQGGTVELSEKRFFPEPSQGTSVDQGFAARVLRSQRENTGKPQGVMSESSGNEPLEVNGKIYHCRWRKIVRGQVGVGAGSPNYLVTTTTTWESDQVPGSLVRERTETSAGDYVTIVEKVVQPFQIDNLAALARPPTVFFQIKPDLPFGSSHTTPAVTNTPAPASNSEPTTPPRIPLPMEQKPSEKQVGNISPPQEIGTYRAYRANEAPVDVTVTFENGKLFSGLFGQRFLLENIGGRRYRLLVPGRNGYYVTFRPVNGDESKTEMFLEQPPPMSNFALVKIK